MRAGDGEAVRALLSQRARQRFDADQVGKLLKRDAAELEALSSAVAQSDARVEVTAELRGPEGWSVRLVDSGAGFQLAASDSMPGAALRPTDALRELRAVLRRRSYHGLLRVLTRDTASALDADMAALVEALSQIDSLRVEVEGRRAVVDLADGHRVVLEREDGVWKIRDFN